MTTGWPLGLENMHIRIRRMDANSLEVTSVGANSFDIHSISSASFSSSDLDTESSRSFFQDHSRSLGRLIGIKPGDGDLYYTNSAPHEDRGRVSIVRVASHATDRHRMEAGQGICIPLMLSVLVKISRSRNGSRR